jgi:hypothetical protein
VVPASAAGPQLNGKPFDRTRIFGMNEYRRIASSFVRFIAWAAMLVGGIVDLFLGIETVAGAIWFGSGLALLVILALVDRWLTRGSG